MDIAGASSAANATGLDSNKFADLDTSKFVKILTEELKNQDPLNPQDTSALLEQINSLRNIESESALQESLKGLVEQNQVAAASNLIGKVVEGLDNGSRQTDGLVTSVRVTNDGVFLELDNGRTMPMNNVTSIFSSNTASAANQG